jgi:hypothetical protein
VADERCAKFTGLDRKHVEFDLNKATLTYMPCQARRRILADQSAKTR